MVRTGTTFVFLIAICDLALLARCAAKSPMEAGRGVQVDLGDLSDAEKQAAVDNISQNLNRGLRQYELSEGDLMEVIYHTSSAVEIEDYRMAVDDELDIEFFKHPQLNRRHVVRPDGKVTIPRRGDFVASGLRADELAETIRASFSDIFRDPEVTVRVVKYSSKIQEIKEAIENAPRGQAKSIAVAPDGYVYLPLLPGVLARGKTLDDLQTELNVNYRQQFNNFEVSLLLEKASGRRIFVFGEVQRPGVMTLTRPTSVLQAIANAGGVLPTGSMKYVKVLYWDESNQPKIRNLNLHAVMDELGLHQELVLADNSVIFVPMTTIAKMDKWVDQYISRLFLYNGASLGFFYDTREITFR